MIVKLLTEHQLEFLSLKGGCRGSSGSTLVKLSNCWKSHAAAQMTLPATALLGLQLDLTLLQKNKMFQLLRFWFLLPCVILPVILSHPFFYGYNI